MSSFTLEMHHIDAFDELIRPSKAIVIGKRIYLQILVSNALYIHQTTQERFSSDCNYCQLSNATTGLVNPKDIKSEKDQKIDILNKAQCGNDFFEVKKLENDTHYQFSFLAFAFDGEEAFDMVSDSHDQESPDGDSRPDMDADGGRNIKFS